MPIGTKRYEKDTINEFLCLLRGPRSVDMADDFWIGIVRHDETPYMTARLFWLVRHIAGRGKKRHLLFAKDASPAAASEAAQRDAIWGRERVDKFNQLIGACA